MSRIEKLIDRLKKNPKDLTYEELKSFGFYEYNKGKTSGARVIFINKYNHLKIELHKPHPNNIVKTYIVKNLLHKLSEMGVKQIHSAKYII